MAVLVRQFLLLVFFTWRVCCFSKTEIEITSSLVKYLNVKNVVLMTKAPAIFKQLSEKKVLASSRDQVALVEDTEQGRGGSELSMVVLEELRDLSAVLLASKQRSSQIILLLFTKEDQLICPPICVPFNQRLLTVHPPNSTGVHLIAENYQIKPDSEMVTSFLGFWNRGHLEMDLTDISYLRKNMKGSQLVMATLTNESCTGFEGCIMREIWDDISGMMNFTTKDIPMNMLNGKEPDAASRILSLNGYTCRLNMLAPIFVMTGSLYIKYSTEGMVEWKSFLSPFDGNVWMAIISWLTISTIAFYAVTRAIKMEFNWHFFTSLDSICNQEGTNIDVTKSISCLLISITNKITAGIIVPAYSAFIISYLTMEIPHVPFTNLEDFIKDGSYRLGTINNTNPANFFKTGVNPNLLWMTKNYVDKLTAMVVNPKDMPNSYTEALPMVCNQRIAFLGYNREMTHLAKGHCQLLEIKPPLLKVNTGLLLAKGSWYKGALNKMLIKFYETGVLHHQRCKIRYRDELDRYERPSVTPIQILEILPLLAILFTGAALSIMFLTMEKKIKL